MEQMVSSEISQHQEIVQLDKTRSRTLSRFNSLVFKREWDSEVEQSDTTDRFIDEYCGQGVKTFDRLVARISDLRGRPMVWAEMGGGGAIAMRQITSLPGMREKMTTFNVDILDFDDRNVDIKALKEIATTTPRALRPENKPTLIKSNIEDVILPKKADLITFVASTFYLDNPLKAICNGYNQLADYGLLMVMSEEKWSDWIKSEGNIYTSDVGPMNHFLEELNTSGIAVATNGRQNKNANRVFNLMMVEKRPGTELELAVKPVDAWNCPNGYKAVYYENGSSVVNIKTIKN